MPDTSRLAEPEFVPDEEWASVSDAARRVRTALEEDRVALAFQPVIHSGSGGDPAFHEGLFRLKSADGSLVPAGAFIHLIEAHEVGRLLDCAALKLGFAALRDYPDLILSINLSARSVGYAPWRAALDEGLREQPGAEKRLILEITEASAMSLPDLIRDFMQEGHRRGLRFALDDFGAGHTSFRYLRAFRFDILKIDGGFVRGIVGDTDNQVLMRAFLDVARHFRMSTVAEWVETQEEACLLSGLGIDFLQGFGLGRPACEPVAIH